MGLCCSRSQDIPISSSSSESFPRHPSKQSRSKPKQRQPSSQIGRVLGKPYADVKALYNLDRELGRGQFAVTYLCTERSTGIQYACKSISQRKLITDRDIGDVRREILMMEHLSGQPNIVEFKGAYEDSEYLHLVMELCSGGELFDRIIAKGSYSEQEAAKIERQVVNVVHVCQFMGVMHRDIKPENFLFANNSEDAPLKITDFGLSVFIEPGWLVQLFCYMLLGLEFSLYS